MSRERIVLAIDKPLDPREGGGLGVWLNQLRHSLEAIGHPVLVVAKSGEGVITLRGADVRERARALADLCQRERVDALICASSDTARLAARQLPDSCRFIVNVQSAKPAHVARETRFADVVDAIVGCSPAVTGEILRQTRDRSRVFHVPNGIAPPVASPTPLADRPRVVGVVGRLEVEQKRAHWLPRIHQRARRLDPALTFQVVGGGRLLPWLDAYARATRGFDLVGQLPRDEVNQFLRCTPRVLLMPSAYEGLSFVMLEALLAGCLVVVSDDPRANGGAIDSRHAVLVEMGSGGILRRERLEDVAQAVAWAAAADAEASKRALRARDLVTDTLSLERMGRGFSDVVTTTLARPPARRQRGAVLARYPKRPLERLAASVALTFENLQLSRTRA